MGSSFPGRGSLVHCPCRRLCTVFPNLCRCGAGDVWLTLALASRLCVLSGERTHPHSPCSTCVQTCRILCRWRKGWSGCSRGDHQVRARPQRAPGPPFLPVNTCAQLFPTCTGCGEGRAASPSRLRLWKTGCGMPAGGEGGQGGEEGPAGTRRPGIAESPAHGPASTSVSWGKDCPWQRGARPVPHIGAPMII